MKTCFKCSQNKHLSEFYKHPQMKDGHLNKCKDCTRKDTISNRNKNIEYYREYEKKRSDLPHRVQARREYAKTEKGRNAGNRAKKRYILRNPEKTQAHRKLNNSLRSKKITKPSHCECCGKHSKRIEGHHEDYTKPLDVEWLCPSCHAKRTFSK